jgi:hypothetical protein
MPSDKQELEAKLTSLLADFNIWCLCLSKECVKSQNFDIAVQDLLALIADQCRIARIDELENTSGDFDGTVMCKNGKFWQTKHDRIKTLEEKE